MGTWNMVNGRWSVNLGHGEWEGEIDKRAMVNGRGSGYWEPGGHGEWEGGAGTRCLVSGRKYPVTQIPRVE